MSENIPISASASATSLHVPPRKRSRNRYDKTKLPTPPPDPRTGEKADKENDFLEYLESLQKGTPSALARSPSIFAPAIAAEDAFDHLEKLYKLMEQMLILREQNAKLHRRVRDLEHYSNLQKIQKELNDDAAFAKDQDLDKDTAFAETILESILSGTKKPPTSGLRQSVLRRQRNRSYSSTAEGNLRRTSVMSGITDKPAKVSKWTKVKAAFKWEKASVTVGDAKSLDSGISGMVPVNLEVARYLRVPSTSDDLTHSPADSGAAEISTPGSLSTASSNEDFHQNVLRGRHEDFHSSDEDHLHHYNTEYIPHSSKKEQVITQKTTGKSLRTPWAMVKDIIQPRNSFKKKHRLSAKSDDINMEESIGSDNEDVFEEDAKCRTPQPKEDARRSTPNVVPPEIVARYQQVIAEDNSAAKDGRKVSKWTRVKKAFLTNPDTKAPINKIDENKKVQAEIRRNYRQLQKKLSMEFQDKFQEWEKSAAATPSNPTPSYSSCLPTDDRKDAAFMKKMDEWQKIKSQPFVKQRQNVQLQSEENLPPEFRKKLQEWQKIKKSSGKEENAKKKLGDWPKWKSIGGQRTEDTQIDYPQLSEDFIKKLETWKQIKAGTLMNEDSESRKSAKGSKSPSPRMNRKDSGNKQGKKVKEQHDRELQWFEKELSKIEKEKQRLERERQKFLEREERLTKLRRSIMGGSKKEVLVHTPSGFYRFEGISRKFTQKLYEWEKAQGIGPEASTFALLSSCYSSEVKSETKNTNTPLRKPHMIRSKSADSIITSAMNLSCPLMSHQPSSLSLNDVENLEKECLIDSKSLSAEYIEQEETLDADEPEALIVEVEDIVEETAAPLQDYVVKQQMPIYQREGLKNMCEGETCLAPKIRRSESTRAQTNYNLIEDVLKILKSLTDTEVQIKKLLQQLDNYEAISITDYTTKFEDVQNDEKTTLIKEYEDAQKKATQSLLEKLTRLQEANSTVAINIASEQKNYAGHHLTDTLETVQDLSTNLLQTTEKLDIITHRRDISKGRIRQDSAYIIEEVNQMRSKILELRRLLSYVCAASDLTTPNRKKDTEKKLHKMSKSENLDERKGQNNLYAKAESSQGATKKRFRYRQKGMQHKTVEDSEEEDNNTQNSERKVTKHKKVLVKAKSIPESFATVSETPSSDKIDDLVLDPEVIQKVVVPTETNIVQLTENENPPDSPVTIFVKTTRKLFMPIVESGISSDNSKENTIKDSAADENPKLSSNNNDVQEKTHKVKVFEKSSNNNKSVSASAKEQTDVERSETTPLIHLPPISASPTTQRKVTKEISPSIRIMLVKYNQKLQESESAGARSGGSSGSASPVAWRSPTSERRVKVQTERYQEELDKLSPLLGGRREVQKSASVGVLHLHRKQVTLPQRRSSRDAPPEDSSKKNKILKSSSAGFIPIDQKHSSADERKPSSLKVCKESKASSSRRSPEVRSKEIQKAKEEFLKAGCVSAPAECSPSSSINYQRNRLSQISVGSESSYDSSAYEGMLIKSASAGMINIDADTYRQIEPEIHQQGYVSLPRSNKKIKEGILSGKFALSNIASKFRKVKMRRGKDNNKMSTVSTLCRQSLVVDITNTNKASDKDAASESRNVSSDDVSSAASSRAGSWIKRSMNFRTKQ